LESTFTADFSPVAYGIDGVVRGRVASCGG
jgi:hypothetical protein